MCSSPPKFDRVLCKASVKVPAEMRYQRDGAGEGTRPARLATPLAGTGRNEMQLRMDEGPTFPDKARTRWLEVMCGNLWPTWAPRGRAAFGRQCYGTTRL